MTRYTINIGDDFPLGGDEPSPRGDPGNGGHRRGRRHGLFLRVLFFLAVAAIVISHPLQTLLVVGVVLLVRRSGWFGGMRDRMRGAWRDSRWGDGQWSRDSWSRWQNCWQSRCRSRAHQRYNRDSDQGGGQPSDGGYRGFV